MALSVATAVPPTVATPYEWISMVQVAVTLGSAVGFTMSHYIVSFERLEQIRGEKERLLYELQLAQVFHWHRTHAALCHTLAHT